jgi:Xaa-Pro dipeptidase
MRDRKFPKFSKGEYAKRNRKLKQLLDVEGADAAIIYGTAGNIANLYYWTNYLARSSSYFITNSDLSNSELFVGTFNHIPTAMEISVIKDISWTGQSGFEKIVDSVRKKFEGQRKSVVALIGGNFPHELVRYLESKLKVRTLNLTAKANQVRAIKSEEEIDWLLKGVGFTDLAMKALEEQLKVGMSEHEIVDVVEHAYVPLGGTTRIHYLGSTSMNSPTIYVPSQSQTSRRLERGDIIITELSAEYGGYAGQIHRPIVIGAKPTLQYSKLYDVALEAYENILSELKDGVTSEILIKSADSAIVDKGYTICDSVVHGYGTDLAYPELGTSNSAYLNPHYEFKENMIIVIQPNPITLDKKFGLQLGNICLVGRNKSQALQKYPIKFVSICG